MQNVDKWYVKNVAGKVFGPIDLETLRKWVRDGRVEPMPGPAHRFSRDERIILLGSDGDVQNFLRF